MIVTRSSALSLQAKQGLPRGEQVLGWSILGTFLLSNPFGPQAARRLLYPPRMDDGEQRGLPPP